MPPLTFKTKIDFLILLLLSKAIFSNFNLKSLIIFTSYRIRVLVNSVFCFLLTSIYTNTIKISFLQINFHILVLKSRQEIIN